MTEFAPFDPLWFRELKRNREDFYNVNNIIESAKFKYDREFNTPKWLVGTGIAILFSGGILNLASNINLFLKLVIYTCFTLAALEFFIALLLILAIDKRQKIAMAYLYREKDKQERNRKLTK